MNTRHEVFYIKGYKFLNKVVMAGLMLWFITAMLLFSGCAYYPARPSYNSVENATAGHPDQGHLRDYDAMNVYALQERKNAIEFEKKLTTSKLGSKANTASQRIGIPGRIRNHSRYETITFLVEGQATTKSFTLYPGEVIEAELPTGKYKCRFFSGSRELSKPWVFSVDHKVNYFYGEWVLWGLAYQNY